MCVCLSLSLLVFCCCCWSRLLCVCAHPEARNGRQFGRRGLRRRVRAGSRAAALAVNALRLAVAPLSRRRARGGRPVGTQRRAAAGRGAIAHTEPSPACRRCNCAQRPNAAAAERRLGRRWRRREREWGEAAAVRRLVRRARAYTRAPEAAHLRGCHSSEAACTETSCEDSGILRGP
ncbi:hypothetical protein T492DRAFT_1029976 [Pavlovales sp. CCMP2436]|nr:hypothetical protein T492DRAFT_1029976 [Pavlovales sp. CCMP2436]